MKVAVLKAGLANQEYHTKQQMRLISKYGTVGPSGFYQDFSFTWINLSWLTCAPAQAFSSGTRASMQLGTCANFNELFNGI